MCRKELSMGYCEQKVKGKVAEQIGMATVRVR